MPVRSTSSFLKVASLSCLFLVIAATTGGAQTDFTNTPPPPLSPAIELAPQSLPPQQETAPPTEPAIPPDSLVVPGTNGSVSRNPTSSPQHQAVTTDTTSAPTVPPAETADGGLSQRATGNQTRHAASSEHIPGTTSAKIKAATKRAMSFLRDGGPSIWAIAALSVITVALILWKTWRLALIGAWARSKEQKAVTLYEDSKTDAALALVSRRNGLRSKVVSAAIAARETLPEDAAREETSRVAKRELGEAAVGLRALELIATIAPLLGLLGTVLGMIAAFQALQESGSRADPSMLAGGIWEALLTTAAGMAVAIPASASLTWFEAVIDRMRRDIEDAAMRVFLTRQAANTDRVQALAAE